MGDVKLFKEILEKRILEKNSWGKDMLKDMITEEYLKFLESKIADIN